MFNKSRGVSLVLALAFVFVAAGAAAQQASTAPKATSEKTAGSITCPVSGEPADAKISWEYKGVTYYFCCESCKAKFIKDPESFLMKKAEAQPAAKDVFTCPMCPDVKSDKPGKCPKCGMDLVKAEPGKDVIIKKMRMEGPMSGQGLMMPHGQMMAGPMMMKGGQGHMGCGMMGGCPMRGGSKMGKDIDVKVDYTKDGVVVSVTSKDPDTVKIIQGRAAMMKQCRQGQEIKKEVIIKEEAKKEPVKK